MRSQLGCDRFDLTERYHAACLPPIPLQSRKISRTILGVFTKTHTSQKQSQAQNRNYSN